MRNKLMLTAILTLLSTATFAGPATPANKTHFSFENATNHSITIEVFDFTGTWKNPIPRHFAVTLAPHDIKPVSFYQNTLLDAVDSNSFAGIQLSDANTTNDNVTINSSYAGGARIVDSSGTLVEETHINNSRDSGTENVDISFWK